MYLNICYRGIFPVMWGFFLTTEKNTPCLWLAPGFQASQLKLDLILCSFVGREGIDFSRISKGPLVLQGVRGTARRKTTFKFQFTNGLAKDVNNNKLREEQLVESSSF